MPEVVAMLRVGHKKCLPLKRGGGARIFLPYFEKGVGAQKVLCCLQGEAGQICLD